MNYEPGTDSITKVLQQCAITASKTGSTCWDFSLRNGQVLSSTARLADGWLCLDASVGKLTSSAWELAQLCGQFDGLVKLALDPQRQLRLRAEIPVTDECNSQLRLPETCAAFQAASTKFHKGKSTRQAKKHLTQTESPYGFNDASDLAVLCSEAGWPAIGRANGDQAVELSAGNDRYQALVQMQAGQVLAKVELAACDQFSEASRQALGVLLLRVNWAVRLARGVILEYESGCVARSEVCFGTTPDPDELSHALSSLSVAARLAGREAKVLQDEAVARQYLAEPR